MNEVRAEAVRLLVAVGAAGIGGALWVFSAMVLPAFDRLRPGQAVACFQRINKAP